MAELSCQSTISVRATIPRFISGENLIDADSSPPQEYIESQHVRIYPGSMVFANAIEGKAFHEKLVIRNCGSTRAFIRICSPTSYAFQIKPLVRGQFLSPGLSIVRSMSYTYMRATAVPFSSMVIYINRKPIYYDLRVFLSDVKLYVIPSTIDFGLVDEGFSGNPQTFTIQNKGTKGCPFVVDLGRNKSELIIEPVRGTIEPESSTVFRIECLGVAGGQFNGEFWIKCESPVRIGFIGFRINPLFNSIHPNSLTDFTLIDFPKTYYGTYIIRSMVVNNISSMSAMFCVVTIIHKELVNLDEASKQHRDYKHFSISPHEGSFLPNEGKIFQFTYRPTKNSNNVDSTSFCTADILRIPYTEVTPMDMPVEYSMEKTGPADDVVSMAPSRYSRSEGSISDIESLLQNTSLSIQAESSLFQQPAIITTDLSKSIRVLLHGEAEEAGISIRPDALDLLQIQNNIPVKRELLLINKSLSLPIIYRYKKACFIEILPKEGFLLPGKSREVECVVTPTNLGSFNIKVLFELLYFNSPKEDTGYLVVGESSLFLQFSVPSQTTPADAFKKFNMGITPMYINEVGYLTSNVRFDTDVGVPRAAIVHISNKNKTKSSDLIAFPNDRPNSLRPWRRLTKCRTICAGILRLRINDQGPYELSPSKLELKHKAGSYCQNYIRQECQRIRKLMDTPKTESSDYDVFDRQMLLNKFLVMKCPSVTLRNPQSAFHVPLSPLQLNRVKVYPNDIDLGKLAPTSKSLLTINIENRNKFEVRIFARPRKSNLFFPHGNRFGVAALEQYPLDVVYISQQFAGRYSAVIDIIMNDNHASTVNLTADVRPLTVTFDSEEIIIENRKSTQYITLVNPLNTPLGFQWYLSDCCFIIEPTAATIPSKSIFICTAMYMPYYPLPLKGEATLRSESNAKQTVSIYKELHEVQVSLTNPQILLNKTPLNLQLEGRTAIRNLGNEQIAFVVLNPEPIQGIRVKPLAGTVESNSAVNIYVHVNIGVCIGFACDVRIDVQGVEQLTLEIVVNVIYPEIVISPNRLRFLEMLPRSFDSQKFTIENISNAPVTVSFCMEDYYEYTVSEHNVFDPFFKSLKVVDIQERESKLLYLHFNPMGAASHSFCVPMVINSLLGPARLGFPQSFDPSSYTKGRENIYLGTKNTQLNEMPGQLSTLHIYSNVKRDVIWFSRLDFSFLYGSDDCDETRGHHLRIQNISEHPYKVLLSTNELFPHFSIKHLKGSTVSVFENAIVCRLDPQETAVFLVEFLRIKPGVFRSKIPIFIQKPSEGKVFNYVHLKGKYFTASIGVADQLLWLEPAPLKFETVTRLFAKTERHRSNCVLMADTNLDCLSVEFDFYEQPCSDVLVILKFNSNEHINFETLVKLYCSCGAETSITVKGIRENCSITTHSILQNVITKVRARRKSSAPYLRIQSSQQLRDRSASKAVVATTEFLDTFKYNPSDRCFPLFPDNDIESPYAIHLRSTVSVVEEWFYHQVFMKEKYCKIPQGFALLPENTEQEESTRRSSTTKAKKPVKDMVIKEVFAKLMGPKIKKYIRDWALPKENLKLINYAYNVYKITKSIIVLQGGLLPHVEPEYLLEYKDYLQFSRTSSQQRTDGAEIMIPQSTFKSLHRQSWLDVCLQLYKVFILARVKFPEKFQLSDVPCIGENQNETIATITADFFQSYARIIPQHSHIFNESETILLHWLKYHFEKKAHVLWNHVGLSLMIPREILDFGTCLQDSIVLMVLTLAFCPYLITYLKEFYLDTGCEELSMHNAAQLLQLWDCLQLSYVITSRQIVCSNRVQMLMLVTYLYQILPTFFPSQTLHFKTGLSTSCTEDIDIVNPNEFPISYKLLLLGNERNPFTVTSDDVKINAGGKFRVNILYEATRMSVEEVTLIVNGEASNERYAKSIVYSLVGEPIPSYPTTTITLSNNLYDVTDHELVIQSPYRVSASYTTFYTVIAPDDISSTELTAVPERKDDFNIQRVCIVRKHFHCDENGVGLLNVTITTIIPVTIETWIVFKNKDVGDFTIKIVTLSDVNKADSATIPLPLPEKFKSRPCICNNMKELCRIKICPRRLILRIPNHNEGLWNCLLNLIKRNSNSKDLQFWKKYEGTSACIEIIKWTAETYQPCDTNLAVIFQKSVNYNISTEEKGAILFPDTIRIDNVRSFGFLETYIHIAENHKIPDNIPITMFAESTLEHRKYNVRPTKVNIIIEKSFLEKKMVEVSRHKPSQGSIALKAAKFISGEDVNSEDPFMVPDYIESNNVRIYPGAMIFRNAIDGKKFHEKIVIKNCGKNRVSIRICQPKSYAFEIKPILRDQFLSPGLSIVRYVSYTYMRATAVPFTSMAIYVNDDPFNYDFKVFVSTVKLAISPRVVDFGLLDNGYAAPTRTLLLENLGTKGCRFAIDLGRNKSDVIIEPIKGVIQRDETITFRIECLRYLDGNFSGEFWIKCETPIRVPFTGNRIEPVFHSIHPNTVDEFTLVDFPKTYYGTHTIRSMVVHNYSSMPAMFCAAARVCNDVMNLDEASKQNCHYTNFKISPSEGSFIPREGKIIQFTYCPNEKKMHGELTSFCPLELIRIPFTEVGPSERLSLNSTEAEDKGTSSTDIESLSKQISAEDSLLEISLIEDVALACRGNSILLEQPAVIRVNISKSVCVLLYGEAEKPGILIRPDALNLEKLEINIQVKRELFLLNKSSHLPIIFRYKKVPFVNIIPTHGWLLPEKSIEVECTITPSHLGFVDINIIFELLYFNDPKEDKGLVVIGHSCIPLKFEVPAETTPSDINPKFNMGITPKYIKEVGFKTDNVRFNTKIEAPRATLLYVAKKAIRKCDNLIAFPNDRPNSLRPWRSAEKCRTICAGMPRLSNPCHDSYQLSPSELDFKQKQCIQYKNFVRQDCQRIKELRATKNVPVDYETSDERQLLFETNSPVRYPYRGTQQKGNTSLIPLNPLELNRVHVYPKDIHLGKAAPNTKILFTIFIENDNKFAIRIFARPRRINLQFPNGDHFRLKQFGKRPLNVIYSAGQSVGRYVAVIDIVMNNNHAFSVNVTVEVLPLMVNFDSNEIAFAKGETSRYVTLSNQLNVPTSFHWGLRESCFTIDPRSAIIPARGTLTCLALYKPAYPMPITIEATLHSECGIKQSVAITKELAEVNVALAPSRIVLEKVPLNLLVKAKTGFINSGIETISFVVVNPEPAHGVYLEPISGIVEANSEVNINVFIKIGACVAFGCDVEIDVQGLAVLTLEIVVVVIYPDIIISPSTILLREIVSNSFDCQSFTITNKSGGLVTISFPLENYVEYSVREDDKPDPFVIPVKTVELNDDDCKLFYLHFNPMGAASNWFCLPIVINDLIGPPCLGVFTSFDPSSYTKTNQNAYSDAKELQFNRMPKRLSHLLIRNTVKGDVMLFSRLKFKFLYCPATPVDDTESELKIWNASEGTCQFCIRTDTLSTNFSVTYVSGNATTVLQNAIVCILCPGEEVIFSVQFLHSQPGTFRSILPVFLKHHLDGDVFNYIHLQGTFVQPTITAQEDIIWLPPAPLGLESVTTFFIRRVKHRCSCTFMANTDLVGLKIAFKQAMDCWENLEVSVKFKSDMCINFETNIRLYCSCNAEKYITIKGCRENCSITTHAILRLNPQLNVSDSSQGAVGIGNHNYASHTSHVNIAFEMYKTETDSSECCFPLFPEDDCESDYAKHMQNTLSALEEWFCHQVFYKQRHCVIPDAFADLSRASVEVYKDNRSDGKRPVNTKNPLLLMEVLTRLVGQHIKKYIPMKDVPKDYTELLNYAYDTYARAIAFIVKQGGLLQHIKPENLLNYTDYLAQSSRIKLNVFDNERKPQPLDETQFNRLHKQSWIDLLLQVFKVFVLARVRCPNEPEPTDDSKSMETVSSISSGFFQSFAHSSIENQHIFNSSETILLHWLTYHFEKNAIDLWSYCNEPPPTSREINNFEDSLSDSVVLMVVTVTFCPYLLKYLEQFYVQTMTEELVLHNAAQLLQLWKMIGLSFVLKPPQIVYPNRVQMVMLVAYLYQILPNFSPSESLYFKTGLSTSCSKLIQLENTNQFTITYKIILLGNQTRVFTTSETEVLIPAKNTSQLQVSYEATKLQNTEATMILNGEACSQRYAKSMVFSMFGLPNPSYATTTIQLVADLYECIDLEFPIQSPYKTEATYSICYTANEPDDVSCKPIPYQDDDCLKIIKRIMLHSPELSCNSHGVGILKLIITPILAASLNTWIIFVNDEVGDFCIKIANTPEYTDIPSLEIPLFLPENFQKIPCVCKHVTDLSKLQLCPRRVALKIPNQNHALWDVVLSLLKKTAPGYEVEFWKKYGGTIAGIGVMKWYMETHTTINKLAQEIFINSVNYSVVEHGTSVTFPASIRIPNVHMAGVHEIYVHLEADKEFPKHCEFLLMSDRKLEYRRYNIKFIKKIGLYIPSFNVDITEKPIPSIQSIL